MNYGDYIKEVAERTSLSQVETKRILKASFETVVEALNAGETFTLPNLGTFGTKVKPQHKSYNPAYEKFMLYPKKRVVTYSASSAMKNETNKDKGE